MLLKIGLEFGRDIVGSGQSIHLTIQAIHLSPLRAAQPGGILNQRVKDRLEVEGGPADHFEHFAGGRLLLESLAQLMRPHLHFLLQVRVRLLELGGHIVELIGEGLKFVAGLHLNALIQRSCADPGRSSLQHLDRCNHPAGEQQAHHDRCPQAHQQENAGPDHGGVKGCKRLSQRLLHEDQPSEGGDGRIGGEDLLPLKVSRDRGLVPGLARLRRARHGVSDLGQRGEGGFLQDQTDVRVRDEIAARIQHVGVTRLPDLDLGHHVPDELQVHFGHGDPRTLSFS